MAEKGLDFVGYNVQFIFILTIKAENSNLERDKI